MEEIKNLILQKKAEFKNDNQAYMEFLQSIDWFVMNEKTNMIGDNIDEVQL